MKQTFIKLKILSLGLFNCKFALLLLGRLGSQDEGLHEPSHGAAVVGELARHLDHHTLGEGGVGVHL